MAKKDDYKKKLAAWQKQYDRAMAINASRGESLRKTGGDYETRYTNQMTGKSYRPSVVVPLQEKYSQMGITPTPEQSSKFATMHNTARSNDSQIQALGLNGYDTSRLDLMNPRIHERQRGATIDAAQTAMPLDLLKAVGTGALRAGAAVLGSRPVRMAGAAIETNPFQTVPRLLGGAGVMAYQKAVHGDEMEREGLANASEDEITQALMHRGVSSTYAKDLARMQKGGLGSYFGGMAGDAAKGIWEGDIDWAKDTQGSSPLTALLNTAVGGREHRDLELAGWNQDTLDAETDPAKRAEVISKLQKIYGGYHINEDPQRTGSDFRIKQDKSKNQWNPTRYELQYDPEALAWDVARSAYGTPQFLADMLGADYAAKALKLGSGAQKGHLVDDVSRSLLNRGDEMAETARKANLLDKQLADAAKIADETGDAAAVAKTIGLKPAAAKANMAADAARQSAGAAVRDSFTDPKELATFVDELTRAGRGDLAKGVADGTLKVGDVLADPAAQKTMSNAAIRSSKDYGMVTSFGRTYGGGVRRAIGRTKAVEGAAEKLQGVRGSRLAQDVPFLGTQRDMYQKNFGDFTGNAIDMANRERAASKRWLESSAKAAEQESHDYILEGVRSSLNPIENQKNLDSLMSLTSIEGEQYRLLERMGRLDSDARTETINKVYDKLSKTGRLGSTTKRDVAAVYDRMAERRAIYGEAHATLATEEGMGELINPARVGEYSPIVRAERGRVGANRKFMEEQYGAGDRYAEASRNHVFSPDAGEAAKDAIEYERQYPTVFDAIMNRGARKVKGELDMSAGSTFETNDTYGLLRRIENANNVRNDNTWRSRVGSMVEGAPPEGRQYELIPNQWNPQPALPPHVLDVDPNLGQAPVSGRVDWRNPNAAEDIFAQPFEPVQQETARSQFLADLGMGRSESGRLTGRPNTEFAYQPIDELCGRYADDAAGMGLGRTSRQHEVRGAEAFYTQDPETWAGRVSESAHAPRQDGLYHVTTRGDLVDNDGVLRSGAELLRIGNGNVGLGGTPHEISATYNKAHAEMILDRMQTLSAAARGEMDTDAAYYKIVEWAENADPQMMEFYGYTDPEDFAQQMLIANHGDDANSIVQTLSEADKTLSGMSLDAFNRMSTPEGYADWQQNGALFIDPDAQAMKDWQPKMYELFANNRAPNRNGGQAVPYGASDLMHGENEIRFAPEWGQRPHIRGSKTDPLWDSTRNKPSFIDNLETGRGYGVAGGGGGRPPIEPPRGFGGIPDEPTPLGGRMRITDRDLEFDAKQPIKAQRRNAFGWGGAAGIGENPNRILEELISPESFAGVFRNQKGTAAGEKVNELLMPLMTVMRPAFTAKNVAGNVSNSFLTGNMDLAAQARAAREMAEVLGNRGVTLGLEDEAAREAAVKSGAVNLPAYNPTAMFREGTNASHAVYQNPVVKPIYNTAQSLSSSAEGQARSALYNQFLDQGMNQDAALRAVNKILYDYELSSLNRGEQALKKYFPFLTFNRRNVPFQAEQSLTRPSYLATQNKLLESLDPNYLKNQEGQRDLSQGRNATTVKMGDSYYNIPLTITDPLNQLNNLQKYGLDAKNNGIGNANLAPLMDVLNNGLNPGTRAEALAFSTLANGDSTGAQVGQELTSMVPILGSAVAANRRAGKQEGLGGDDSAIPRFLWNLISGVSSEKYDPTANLSDRIFARDEAVNLAVKDFKKQNHKNPTPLNDIIGAERKKYNADPLNYEVPESLKGIMQEPLPIIPNYSRSGTTGKEVVSYPAAYIQQQYGDYIAKNYPEAKKNAQGYYTMDAIRKIQMARNKSGKDWDKQLPWMMMVSTYSKQQQNRKSTKGMHRYYNKYTGRYYYAK